ncbi:MAG: transcription elongation factor GreA [Myxococcota bacterium]|nr:transcription elongation factor GreA [Myxococcota bacterium]
MSLPTPIYMRPSGQSKLRAELKRIREVDRPAVVEAIEEARAHGDLKENAEYHAAKEKQGMLHARMTQVEDILSRAHVIDPATVELEKVAFGCTVSVLDLDTDTELTYTIVGSEEADAANGLISYQAPLAKALMGKEEGDEVLFKAPKGERHFEVVGVEYG